MTQRSWDELYAIEEQHLLESVPLAPSTILDVGCGLGRYLKRLVALGHSVTGIEKSGYTRELMKKGGYTVVSSVEELGAQTFDVVLMSHIIEHIAPSEFIPFMDSHLQLLAEGGILLIATPLMHGHFFDDYDHVKPYSALALTNIYGDGMQYQRKPRFRLKQISLWYRRWPRQCTYCDADSKAWRRLVSHVLNPFFWNLFWIFPEMFGVTTGWIGVFQKVSLSGKSATELQSGFEQSVDLAR
jgi:SAM-dependent methyltransferase